MRIVILSLLILAAAAPISRAESETALAALKALPADKAAQLAGIEAREGAPNPERWYLIVYDGSNEKGLHEYAVAGQKIVASRAISQFMDTVKPGDVFGANAVKIDSDQLAKLANDYAKANNLSINKIGYELKKATPDAPPVWKVICTGTDEKIVGSLTLAAAGGEVSSHEGFAVTPAPMITPTPETKSGISVASSKPEPTPTKKKTPFITHRVRPTASPNNGTPQPGNGIGNIFHKLFGGHSTNNNGTSGNTSKTSGTNTQ